MEASVQSCTVEAHIFTINKILLLLTIGLINKVNGNMSVRLLSQRPVMVLLNVKTVKALAKIDYGVRDLQAELTPNLSACFGFLNLQSPRLINL